MRSSSLDVLEQMSELMGFPPVRRQGDGGFDCPVHGVRLVADELGAFNGWHRVLLCERADGSCPFGVDGSPVEMECPEEPEARASVVVVEDLGGGMALVSLPASAVLGPPAPADPRLGVVDNGDGSWTWTAKAGVGELADDWGFGLVPVAVDGGALDPATVSVEVEGDWVYVSVRVHRVPDGRGGIQLWVSTLADEDLAGYQAWAGGPADARDQFGRAMFTDVVVEVRGEPLRVRLHVEPDEPMWVSYPLKRGVHEYPVEGLRIPETSGWAPTPAMVRTYTRDGVPFADVQVVSARQCDTALTIGLLAPGEDPGELDDADDAVLVAGSLGVDGVECQVLVRFAED